MTHRREVLQATAVLAVIAVLPACGTDQAIPLTPAREPDADQAAELEMIAAYDAALSAPEVPDRAALQDIRDEHVAHLQALGWSEVPPAPADSAPLGRRQLRRAEQRAVRSRTRAARTAEDAERAQILALIAASEAQHVVRLGGR